MQENITTGKESKVDLRKEVSNMLGKTKSFFKSIFIGFNNEYTSEKSDNEWRTSVFELTDEEIFRYVNETLSNFSFLKSSYSFKNISENVYLKRYLENTHEALEVLRIVILSRAKNLKTLSSWNTRVMDTISEIEIALSSYNPNINRCFTDISNISINGLKILIGNPRKELNIN